MIKCSLIALSIYGNDFLQISGQVSAEDISLGSVSPELKCGSSRVIMMGEGNKQQQLILSCGPVLISELKNDYFPITSCKEK